MINITPCFHVGSISASRKPWWPQHFPQLRCSRQTSWTEKWTHRVVGTPIPWGAEVGIRVWSYGADVSSPWSIWTKLCREWNELNWDIVVIKDIFMHVSERMLIMLLFLIGNDIWRCWCLHSITASAQFHLPFCCDERQLLTVGYQWHQRQLPEGNWVPDGVMGNWVTLNGWIPLPVLLKCDTTRPAVFYLVTFPQSFGLCDLIKAGPSFF